MMPKLRTGSVALLLLVWMAMASAAPEMTGRVIGITDGDTLTLLVAEGAGYLPMCRDCVELPSIRFPTRSFLSIRSTTGAVKSLNKKLVCFAKVHGVQVVGGSNPLAPTNFQALSASSPSRCAGFVS